MNLKKNLNIATILPYKENYTFGKASAASLWVSEFFKKSKYKKNNIIYGHTKLKDYLTKNYKNINLNNLKSKLKSTTNEYAEKLTKEINVGGAFHSPLMKVATESLAEKVNSIQISNLKYPVISNFDGKPNKESSKIKYSLVKQIENPVLWYQSIKEMSTFKLDKFIEVGPGNVLQGLNKRIVREIPCIGVSNLRDLTSLNV